MPNEAPETPHPWGVETSRDRAMQSACEHLSHLPGSSPPDTGAFKAGAPEDDPGDPGSSQVLSIPEAYHFPEAYHS